MPKTFSVIVPGDPPMRDGTVPPRAFRWDIESKTLSTDLGTDGGMEDPLSGAPSQKEVTITEENCEHNPDYIRFWRATATHRLAFQLCEEEGLPMDEALLMAEQAMNGNGAPIANEAPPTNEIGERVYHERSDVIPFQNPNPGAEPVSLEPEMPETNPVAGIVITNQQLILSMAFKLLEQYVPEDDPNSGMVELLKNKVEELDGYEIVI